MSSAIAVFIAPSFVAAWFIGRFLLFISYSEAFHSLDGLRARNAQSLSSFCKLICIMGGLMAFLFVAQSFGEVAAYASGAAIGLVFSMINPFIVILFYIFTRDPGVLPRE